MVTQGYRVWVNSQGWRHVRFQTRVQDIPLTTSRRQGFDRGRDGGHQILGAKAWNRKLGSEAWKFLRPGDISQWHLGSMDGPLVAEAAEETGNSTESWSCAIVVPKLCQTCAIVVPSLC